MDDPLEKVIQDALVPTSGVLIGYVIVATYADSDGSQGIVSDCSMDMQPWVRAGLLAFASDTSVWED